MSYRKDIFERIRSESEYVVAAAKHLKVDFGALVQLGERLNFGNALDQQHDADTHYLGNSDDTLRFFLILDTINFGSGYFPSLKKETGFSGYFTIASHLTEFFQKYGCPEIRFLQNITTEECAILFGQRLNNQTTVDLLSHFSRALNQLGNFIHTHYSGDYLGVLRSNTPKHAGDIVLELAEMSYFNDIMEYNGRRVPFFKKAQIFIQDIVLADSGHKLCKIRGLSELTAFADNILPYVFRNEDVLHLSSNLSKKIQNEEKIVFGSDEEIELRAAGVYCTEVLTASANEVGFELCPRNIDFLLWNKGQEQKKWSSLKRHRCLTPFY